MTLLNETHDPLLRSWVPSAQDPETDFPIQNLPFGCFSTPGGPVRGGVAIGDQIVDLAALLATGILRGDAAAAATAGTGPALNDLMALGPAAHSALRLALSRALREGSPARPAVERCLVPQSEATYALPAVIGDYTDFYTSIHHATNIGRLFRPDNPLLPNYRWIPIGYHGRSSSIGVSGQQVLRPSGQKRPGPDGVPGFGASERMDYELELGVVVGVGNDLGEAVPIRDAEAHVFGICLLNDWSARDIQGWEYQPLGPFLGKNFATTLSPWVVTMEALAPFRAAWTREEGEPQPLPYLDAPAVRAAGALDITLEARLETARSRAQGEDFRLSLGSYTDAYWTVSQLVTHHTVNGCNLRPGDVLGTGTLSGPGPGSRGALIEITVGGKEPLTLPNGETRTFLADGDAVILRAWCERPGAARIGFGECRGTLLPAR